LEVEVGKVGDEMVGEVSDLVGAVKGIDTSLGNGSSSLFWLSNGLVPVVAWVVTGTAEGALRPSVVERKVEA